LHRGDRPLRRWLWQATSFRNLEPGQLTTTIYKGFKSVEVNYTIKQKPSAAADGFRNPSLQI